MKRGVSRRPTAEWHWPSTEWSSSGGLSSRWTGDSEAASRLILRYQAPLRAYLTTVFPQLENQADELLQDFAQDRILKGGWLDKPERKRGRFRDFLKTSLKNFVRDRLRARHPEMVSMNGLDLDLPVQESGSETFDLEWARTILAEVLKRMEMDCRRKRGKNTGRAQIWETFRLRLLQPILEDANPLSYEELVTRLGIASPYAAQNLLVTAKRIFCRHLNAVIAEYEETGSAARMELEDLRRFLEGLAGEKKE